MENQQVCPYLNALLGDGHLRQETLSTQLIFGSSSLSMIEYKAKLIGGVVSKPTFSGWNKKPQYHVQKFCHKRQITRQEAITAINLQDFYLWFLDDGTLHQKRGWGALGSHCLTMAQNMELQWHLWHTMGIESQLAFDKRKTRATVLWYITFRRNQMLSITPEIKAFAESNAIKGFEHKYKTI